jgi:peroxisomal membrane protein 4
MGAEVVAPLSYASLVQVLMGLRNGIIYGVKVRFPHALVMTLLFNRTDPSEMASKIFFATKQHAINLGSFVVLFKACLVLLRLVSSGSKSWHSFLAGLVCGGYVWGDNNPVNMQINMYLLSRILQGFLNLYLQKNGTGKLPLIPSGRGFRVFGAMMWACVMWLFYTNSKLLQGSLASSMNYLYRESDNLEPPAAGGQVRVSAADTPTTPAYAAGIVQGVGK